MKLLLSTLVAAGAASCPTMEYDMMFREHMSYLPPTSKFVEHMADDINSMRRSQCKYCVFVEPTVCYDSEKYINELIAENSEKITDEWSLKKLVAESGHPDIIVKLVPYGGDAYTDADRMNVVVEEYAQSFWNRIDNTRAILAKDQAGTLGGQDIPSTLDFMDHVRLLSEAFSRVPYCQSYHYVYSKRAYVFMINLNMENWNVYGSEEARNAYVKLANSDSTTSDVDMISMSHHLLRSTAMNDGYDPAKTCDPHLGWDSVNGMATISWRREEATEYMVTENRSPVSKHVFEEYSLTAYAYFPEDIEGTKAWGQNEKILQVYTSDQHFDLCDGFMWSLTHKGNELILESCQEDDETGVLWQDAVFPIPVYDKWERFEVKHYYDDLKENWVLAVHVDNYAEAEIDLPTYYKSEYDSPARPRLNDFTVITYPGTDFSAVSSNIADISIYSYSWDEGESEKPVEKATPKPKQTPKPTKEPTAVAFVDTDGDGVPDSAPTDATMVDDSVNDDGTAADESTMPAQWCPSYASWDAKIKKCTLNDEYFTLDSCNLKNGDMGFQYVRSDEFETMFGLTPPGEQAQNRTFEVRFGDLTYNTFNTEKEMEAAVAVLIEHPPVMSMVRAAKDSIQLVYSLLFKAPAFEGIHLNSDVLVNMRCNYNLGAQQISQNVFVKDTDVVGNLIGNGVIPYELSTLAPLEMGKQADFVISPRHPGTFFAQVQDCTVFSAAKNFTVYPDCPSYLNVQMHQAEATMNSIGVSYRAFKFNDEREGEAQVLKCIIDVSVDAPTTKTKVCGTPPAPKTTPSTKSTTGGPTAATKAYTATTKANTAAATGPMGMS